MIFFRQWGRFMMAGAQAHARWEIETARTILSDRRRLFVLWLLILPVLVGAFALAAPLGEEMPEFLGGKKA